MKKLFYSLSVLLLLGACSVEESGEIAAPLTITENQPAIKAVAVEALKSYNLCFPHGLLKRGQQLWINDLENAENIYQIDLSNQAKKSFCPRVRTRSGKAVQLNSLASDGKGGWTAFDWNAGHLTKAAPLTRSGDESVISLPTGEQHLWAVPAGDYVVATGVYEQGRYLLYHPGNGAAAYYVSYPDHPQYPRLKEKTKAVLYASNVLKVRPDNGAFVCADMYSGGMDICRINAGRIELVRRLNWHAPKVEIRERRKHPRVAYYRDNRLGFTDVAVTADRIYAVYSGRTYQEYQNKFQRCRTLLELDWEGNVLGSYALDTDITHITYDPEEKALFGIGYCPALTLVRLDI